MRALVRVKCRYLYFPFLAGQAINDSSWPIGSDKSQVLQSQRKLVRIAVDIIQYFLYSLAIALSLGRIKDGCLAIFNRYYLFVYIAYPFHSFCFFTSLSINLLSLSSQTIFLPMGMALTCCVQTKGGESRCSCSYQTKHCSHSQQRNHQWKHCSNCHHA